MGKSLLISALRLNDGLPQSLIWRSHYVFLHVFLHLSTSETPSV